MNVNLSKEICVRCCELCSSWHTHDGTPITTLYCSFCRLCIGYGEICLHFVNLSGTGFWSCSIDFPHFPAFPSVNWSIIHSTVHILGISNVYSYKIPVQNEYWLTLKIWRGKLISHHASQNPCILCHGVQNTVSFLFSSEATKQCCTKIDPNSEHTTLERVLTYNVTESYRWGQFFSIRVKFSTLFSIWHRFCQ